MSANSLDWNDWDDTVLLQDWNRAFAEYEKYHSIYQSGKTLEEALTKEELEEVGKELRGQDLKTTNNNSETNVRMDEEDGEIEIKTESAAGAAENPYVTEEEILVKTEDQTALTTANAPGAAPLSAPRNLEGTPEGEALQNMIQAYYWAGYYKGFYEGLQQAKGSNER